MKQILLFTALSISLLLFFACGLHEYENPDPKAITKFNIKGTVTDAASGEPIEGAVVTMSFGDETQQKKTGKNGDFSFAISLSQSSKNKQSGNYKFLVQAKGYEDTEIEFPLADLSANNVPPIKMNVANFLTIKNQTSYDIKNVKWNDVDFGSIEKGSPITKSVGKDSGYVYFTRGSDNLNVHTKHIVATEDILYIIYDTTLVVELANPANEKSLSAIKATKVEIPPTISFSEANLMLQSNDLPKASWDVADNSCKNSQIDNYNDWRLPNNAELGVINSKEANINSLTGNSLTGTDYWSSEISGAYYTYYYFLNLKSGTFGSGYHFDNHSVRCVRYIVPPSSSSVAPSSSSVPSSSSKPSSSSSVPPSSSSLSPSSSSIALSSSSAVVSSSSVALPSSSSVQPPSSSSVAPSSSSKPSSSSSVVTSGTFKDDRDSKTYKYVVIGTKTWMADNLNYATEGSLCYDATEANCTTYGRLYAWSTAKTACPSGWHLPDDAEWTTLINFVGTAAGKKLKSISGWNSNGNGTDDYGFSALPGGYRNQPIPAKIYVDTDSEKKLKAASGQNDYGFSAKGCAICDVVNPAASYVDIGNSGTWWSFSDYGYFKMSSTSTDVTAGRFKTSNGSTNLNYNSVRCVKD